MAKYQGLTYRDVSQVGPLALQWLQLCPSQRDPLWRCPGCSTGCGGAELAQEQSRLGAVPAGLCRMDGPFQGGTGAISGKSHPGAGRRRMPEASRGCVVCPSPLKRTKCHALLRGWDRCHQLKVFFRNI